MRWAWAETALSVVGAGIAGFLWVEHVRNADVPCTSGGGCEMVAQSHWGHLALGPVSLDTALAGLIGYVVLLTLGMMRLAAETERGQRVLHGLIWAISAFGFVFSWFLQWYAHAKVGAFCIWCRASAITMTLIFLTATAEFFLPGSRAEEPQQGLNTDV